MTPEKIVHVAQTYSNQLTARGILPQRIDPTCSFAHVSQEAVLQHALYLTQDIPRFARVPGKLGKANRHLSFVQACLSFSGLYTLNELRQHNVP